jgi:hypothetical protein
LALSEKDVWKFIDQARSAHGNEVSETNKPIAHKTMEYIDMQAHLAAARAFLQSGLLEAAHRAATAATQGKYARAHPNCVLIVVVQSQR